MKLYMYIYIRCSKKKSIIFTTPNIYIDISFSHVRFFIKLLVTKALKYFYLKNNICRIIVFCISNTKIEN